MRIKQCTIFRWIFKNYSVDGLLKTFYVIKCEKIMGKYTCIFGLVWFVLSRAIKRTHSLIFRIFIIQEAFSRSPTIYLFASVRYGCPVLGTKVVWKNWHTLVKWRHHLFLISSKKIINSSCIGNETSSSICVVCFIPV